MNNLNVRGHRQKKFLNGCLAGRKAAMLSSRQSEVLKLIAEGFPNKKIADSLSISIKTVEKHRQEVMNKLNIHNTAMLARYAVFIGLVESDPGFRWAGSVGRIERGARVHVPARCGYGRS
jgi:DNA-binding NarL/FixJ family response regulator